MAVFLLTLGCPKNEVDSEQFERKLMESGVAVVGDPEEADTLIVNTCCFIEDAKRESIEETLRLSGLKGGYKRLAIIGCMGQRYGDELQKEMPEVDAVFGLGDEENVIGWVKNASSPSVCSPAPAPGAEILTSYSYLKIAEGCDRKCSFCVIPSVRGRFRSTGPDEILKEAERKVNAGALELILIAQDITRYGGKEFDGYGLKELVRDLASIDGDFHVRLLYLYPTDVDEGLMELLASEEKVSKYLDIPLQHSEDRVLRLMKRRGTRKEYLRLVRRLRRMAPGVALRTTMMVGFPGETEEDFRGLMDFVSEAAFDHLGAFKYSREEGTAAYGMKGRVPAEVIERRYGELMELQAGISLEHNRELVGREFKALIDGFKGGDAAVGRIYSQAPGIDGVTLISGAPDGARSVRVRITGAGEYDLEAEAAA